MLFVTHIILTFLQLMSQRGGYGGRTQPQNEAVHGQNVRDNQFKCTACGKNYIHRSSLARHQSLECGKEPQFQCPYCPKKSKLKSNLKQHIILKHEGPISRM